MNEKLDITIEEENIIKINKLKYKSDNNKPLKYNKFVISLNNSKINSSILKNKNQFMNNPKIDCKCIDLNSINIDFCEGISIIHIHARSLVKHFDDIILLLDYCTFKFNIIVITETWLHDFNKDLYNIDTYNCTRVGVIRINKF